MDELQTLLTPDLYRKNPFRILNLPVTASAREVQRREARRQIEARLGIAAGQTGGGALALIPPPDEEQVKGALDRLHNPTDRFFAELFWFWPSSDLPDEAMLALEQGNTDEAVRLWSAELPADRRIAARHNLAILYHLLALDDEIGLAHGTADTQQAARVQTLWPRALGHWCDVHADPEFRGAVAAHAAAINDVRVSEQLVRDTLESLPSGVLRINAQIAFAAAERSDLNETRRHLRLLSGSRFEPAASTEAIRSALEPWQERIKQAIESARANWSRTPHRANQHVRTMHAACEGLLSVVDAVLSDGKTSGAESYGALRDALHDMVADAMRDGQIVFTRKTDDWDEAAKLIELALHLATGGALRSRLTEELGTLRDIAKNGNNWCAPGYWDLPDATVAVLEEARERTRVGDFDGALARLVPLDVSIGRPLRRAAAYCLSVSAIRSFNAAISEFNKSPETRRRLMEKVGQDPSIILETPSPSLPSYMNPRCPLCRKSFYTRWTIFEVHGVPMWLCEDCSDRDRREIEDQRATLRGEVYSALQRILLADEVDPGEAGVTRNLEVLRKHAREIKCATPDTAPLRARLDPKGNRETQVPYSVPSDPGDNLCYFCRENAPNPGCSISVPVCGDKETGSRLLGGRSTRIKVATVSVPRCQGCRDAHSRRRQWEIDYANAARAAVRGWLVKRPSTIGALICLAVGLLVRDGRAGIDVPAVFTAMVGHATPGLELAVRLSPVACGLLAGGAVTASLMWSARRRRARNLKLFLAKHPEPPLPAGVEPESSYVNFRKLKDLLQQNWSFGHVYRPDGKEPLDVKGLVLATS